MLEERVKGGWGGGCAQPQPPLMLGFDIGMLFPACSSVIRGGNRDVYIEVIDRGPGLPPEITPSLFSEGVRGEAGADSERAGLGLGLYMVYRYTIWLDGGLWYELNQNGGTTFTVRLPREVRR